MGWTGIIFPEEFGGAGMGYGELGMVLEECGRVLAPEPFLSTVLLGGNAILLGGSDPLKKELLPGVCSGERILAMAFQEHGTLRSPTRSRRAPSGTADGYRIDGQKQFVLDAHVADSWSWWREPAGEPGQIATGPLALRRRRRRARDCRSRRNQMVDGRNAADVELDWRSGRTAERVLGEVGCRGRAARRRLRSRASIGLSAEMLGHLRGGLRAHARVPEGSRAVRREDRQLPGPASPRRRHVLRARAGAVRRARRRDRTGRGPGPDVPADGERRQGPLLGRGEPHPTRRARWQAQRFPSVEQPAPWRSTSMFRREATGRSPM